MSTGPDSEPFLDEIEPRLTDAEVALNREVVRVAVTGDLDISTAAAFRRRLAEILDSRPCQRLELDLSALEFCDVTGLRALDALGQTSAQARAATAGPALDLLLELCQTSTILGSPRHRRVLTDGRPSEPQPARHRRTNRDGRRAWAGR